MLPERKQILVVDDELNLRRVLSAQLARDGYRIRTYVPFGAAWYLIYRRAGNPARIVAAIFGAVLLAVLVVQLGRASIGVETSARLTLGIAYAMVSHVTYAILGSRLRMF